MAILIGYNGQNPYLNFFKNLINFLLLLLNAFIVFKYNHVTKNLARVSTSANRQIYKDCVNTFRIIIGKHYFYDK